MRMSVKQYFLYLSLITFDIVLYKFKFDVLFLQSMILARLDSQITVDSHYTHQMLENRSLVHLHFVFAFQEVDIHGLGIFIL
jgi:hypothetical protein